MLPLGWWQISALVWPIGGYRDVLINSVLLTPNSGLKSPQHTSHVHLNLNNIEIFLINNSVK